MPSQGVPDINSPPENQPCFYCRLPVAADEAVCGADTVAHRSCLHTRKVDHLRTRHPHPPSDHHGRNNILRLLAEAGVSPEELWG